MLWWPASPKVDRLSGDHSALRRLKRRLQNKPALSLSLSPLCRPSGTEDVVRVYAEAETQVGWPDGAVD